MRSVIVRTCSHTAFVSNHKLFIICVYRASEGFLLRFHSRTGRLTVERGRRTFFLSFHSIDAPSIWMKKFMVENFLFGNGTKVIVDRLHVPENEIPHEAEAEDNQHASKHWWRLLCASHIYLRPCRPLKAAFFGRQTELCRLDTSGGFINSQLMCRFSSFSANNSRIVQKYLALVVGNKFPS